MKIFYLSLDTNGDTTMTMPSLPEDKIEGAYMSSASATIFSPLHSPSGRPESRYTNLLVVAER